MRYKNYLQTKHWKITRLNHYQKEENRHCKFCGATENLHVHHKRYRAGKKSVLFREKPNILITLCSDCHNKQHIMLKKERITVSRKKLLAKLGTMAFYRLGHQM